MPRPIAYPRNILENATVTVTGEVALQPKELLFDRDTVIPYADSGTSSPRRVTADQGASGPTYPWDTWIVPPGHNLSGLTLTAESSTDMAAWGTEDTFTPSGSLLVLRTIGSPVTKRGVRLGIASPGSPPSFAELFFALKFELPVGPSIGGLASGDLYGRDRKVSRSGHPWNILRFGPQWSARYRLADLTVAQRDSLLAMSVILAGGTKPFYLADHDGTVRYVEWLNAEILFEAQPVTYWDLPTMDLLEVV